MYYYDGLVCRSVRNTDGSTMIYLPSRCVLPFAHFPSDVCTHAWFYSKGEFCHFDFDFFEFEQTDLARRFSALVTSADRRRPAISRISFSLSLSLSRFFVLSGKQFSFFAKSDRPTPLFLSIVKITSSEIFPSFWHFFGVIIVVHEIKSRRHKLEFLESCLNRQTSQQKYVDMYVHT